jgi:hypothetical protein
LYDVACPLQLALCFIVCATYRGQWCRQVGLLHNSGVVESAASVKQSRTHVHAWLADGTTAVLTVAIHVSSSDELPGGGLPGMVKAAGRLAACFSVTLYSHGAGYRLAATPRCCEKCQKAGSINTESATTLPAGDGLWLVPNRAPELRKKLDAVSGDPYSPGPGPVSPGRCP